VEKYLDAGNRDRPVTGMAIGEIGVGTGLGISTGTRTGTTEFIGTFTGTGTVSVRSDPSRPSSGHILRYEGFVSACVDIMLNSRG
jgi:hypothetical protein